MPRKHGSQTTQEIIVIYSVSLQWNVTRELEVQSLDISSSSSSSSSSSTSSSSSIFLIPWIYCHRRLRETTGRQANQWLTVTYSDLRSGRSETGGAQETTCRRKAKDTTPSLFSRRETHKTAEVDDLSWKDEISWDYCLSDQNLNCFKSNFGTLLRKWMDGSYNYRLFPST